MKYFVLMFMFAITHASEKQAKLPSYITPCRAADSECLKNALKELQPHLKQGIPEFNLPSIDPLPISDHNQSDFSSVSMPYNTTLLNIRYTGTSNFGISKFDVHLHDSKFDLIINFSLLKMSAHEIVVVDAFGFKLDGEWPTVETYENVTISLSLNGVKYFKKGKEHIKWTENLLSVSLGAVNFKVDVSYKDGIEYKKFLDIGSQQYRDIFYAEVERYIKETLGYFILRSLNIVHEIFPLDMLYNP